MFLISFLKNDSSSLFCLVRYYLWEWDIGYKVEIMIFNKKEHKTKQWHVFFDGETFSIAIATPFLQYVNKPVCWLLYRLCRIFAVHFYRKTSAIQYRFVLFKYFSGSSSIKRILYMDFLSLKVISVENSIAFFRSF